MTFFHVCFTAVNAIMLSTNMLLGGHSIA